MEIDANKIQTSKEINGKQFHLHQIVKHRVSDEDAPESITSKNLISDKIFLDNVEWIITSLSDGVTLTRPGFEKETVIYSERYIKTNINRFDPLKENEVPLYGH